MRNNDQDVIDYIREHGCVTSGRLMFFMDQAGVCWNSIKEVDTVLTRLVAKERLIASTNDIVFRLPHGHHQSDCEFDIREAKRVGGMSVWGIVWHTGSESWSWETYGLALDHAREKIHQLVGPVLVLAGDC